VPQQSRAQRAKNGRGGGGGEGKGGEVRSEEGRGGGRGGRGGRGERERGLRGNADICQEIDNSNKLVAKHSNRLPNGTIAHSNPRSSEPNTAYPPPLDTAGT